MTCFFFISLKTHFLLDTQLLFRTDSTFYWITQNSLVSTGTLVDTGCLGNSSWSRYTHRGSPSQCLLPPGPLPGDSVAGASPTDTHTNPLSEAALIQLTHLQYMYLMIYSYWFFFLFSLFKMLNKGISNCQHQMSRLTIQKKCAKLTFLCYVKCAIHLAFNFQRIARSLTLKSIDWCRVTLMHTVMFPEACSAEPVLTRILSMQIWASSHEH